MVRVAASIARTRLTAIPAPIREVMRQRPGYEWSVSELRDAVLDRKWIEPSDRVLEATRTNIIRAHEQWPEEITRVRPGMYVWRDPNADGPAEAGPSHNLLNLGGGDGYATSVTHMSK